MGQANVTKNPPTINTMQTYVIRASICMSHTAWRTTANSIIPRCPSVCPPYHRTKAMNGGRIQMMCAIITRYTVFFLTSTLRVATTATSANGSTSSRKVQETFSIEQYPSGCSSSSSAQRIYVNISPATSADCGSSCHAEYPARLRGGS